MNNSSREIREEDLIEGDYPIHAGYVYLVDGTPRMSNVSCTAAQFKKALGAKEIRKCDIVGRDLC